jgi:hypothetical protein
VDVRAADQLAAILAVADPGFVGSDSGGLTVDSELTVKPESGVRAPIDRNEHTFGHVHDLGVQAVLALHEIGGQILGFVVGLILGALTGTLRDLMAVQVQNITGVTAAGGFQRSACGSIEFLFKIVKAGCRRDLYGADPITHGNILSWVEFLDDVGKQS